MYYCSDIYAEIQKGVTPNKRMSRSYLTSQLEPTYAETPALPPKEDFVVFEDNSPYESSNGGTSMQGPHATVDMIDNDLYDRRY